MASKYTKEEIRKIFLEMLNETSLKKITIKALSKKCQINRNTFYYHYSDIYELLSEIFQIELAKVIENYDDSCTWEESFIKAAKFAIENQRAIYHVYYSLRREDLSNYISKVAENVMIRYVKSKSKNIPATEDNIKWIAYFYQCALTEMLMRWIASGMQEDPKAIIRKIGLLFDGNIEISLKRSLTSMKLIQK